jgi:hypothetical protein
LIFYGELLTIDELLVIVTSETEGVNPEGN